MKVFIRNVRRINCTLIHWIWRWRKLWIYTKFYYVKNTDLIQQTSSKYLHFLLKQEARDETQIMWSFYSKRRKNQLHSNTLNMKVKKTMDLHESFVMSTMQTWFNKQVKNTCIFYFKTRSSRSNANHVKFFFFIWNYKRINCTLIHWIWRWRKLWIYMKVCTMSKIQSWFNTQAQNTCIFLLKQEARDETQIYVKVFIRHVRRIYYTLIHWIWRWRKLWIYTKFYYVKNKDLIQQTN